MIFDIKSNYQNIVLALFVPVFFNVTGVQAGAYTFAGETNGVDLITHPNTYTGSENTVTVRICIDPTSPNATDMEIPVQNNINIYNKLQPTTGNVLSGGNNNIPSGDIDFESVALHEIGHCLGMAHVNLASESGLTGNNQNYTKSTDGVDNSYGLNDGVDNTIGSADDVRGDDVNLHWFRKSNNNPFTIDSVVDNTTYSRDLADLPSGDLFAANADRDLSLFLALPKTEAVMQQGSFFDEAQRTLNHDDVATISYAASGLDEAAGTGDDYNVVLEYGGISTTNCDVSMSVTTTSSLAFCSTGATFIGTSPPNPVFNHLRITTASIEFGDSFSWFYNTETINQAPVLNAIGAQYSVEQGSTQINLTASDADASDTLSFVALNVPSFAGFIDNGDGTATITVNPALGDASTSMITVTVSDDGLPILDATEVFSLEVFVQGADSDNDGLTDFEEATVYFTMINNPDSDGDFINDGDEVTYGSDPNDINNWPNIADGDIAPLGAPDGIVNAADYLLAQRIAIGELTATSLELAHGDLYPVSVPDGVIDASDLVLLLQLVQ